MWVLYRILSTNFSCFIDVTDTDTVSFFTLIIWCCIWPTFDRNMCAWYLLLRVRYVRLVTWKTKNIYNKGHVFIYFIPARLEVHGNKKTKYRYSNVFYGKLSQSFGIFREHKLSFIIFTLKSLENVDEKPHPEETFLFKCFRPDKEISHCFVTCSADCQCVQMSVVRFSVLIMSIVMPYLYVNVYLVLFLKKLSCET